MRKFKVLALALCLATCNFGLAQQSSSPPHHKLVKPDTSVTIYGKDHPELIPDATARSLVLSVLSVSQEATDQDRAARTAHINRIGLEPDDMVRLTVIVDAFRTRHDALVKTFNDSIPPSSTAQIDNTEFQHAREEFERSRQAVILSTVEQIKRELSPEGGEAFLHFVQAEKVRMAVSGGGQ
ncbi:MAG TPA: hypothetical protein VI386_29505 [Candidatus Sulfotelmatobacter sp.]